MKLSLKVKVMYKLQQLLIIWLLVFQRMCTFVLNLVQQVSSFVSETPCHTAKVNFFIDVNQDFTVINSVLTIPANQMSVTTDVFNAGTDDFFEMDEDFTISVIFAVINTNIIVGGNTLRINILDDGQSPGEYPHMLGLGKELTRKL